MSAATCTETYGQTINHPEGGIIQEIVFTWTATDAGAVTSAVSTTAFDVDGIVLGIKTMDNGTNPGNGYTATFSDEDGYAFATVTGTTGTVTYYAAPTVAGFMLMKQKVSLAVASAGNAGQGKTVLYVHQSAA